MKCLVFIVLLRKKIHLDMVSELFKHIFLSEMSISIVKRGSDDVREFENKEDFINYYDNHRTELDALSTCMLNKKFKIDGYHLGRSNKQLKLIPLNLYRPSEYQVNQENNMISMKIDVLNQKIDNLTKMFSQLLRSTP